MRLKEKDELRAKVAFKSFSMFQIYDESSVLRGFLLSLDYLR